MLTFYVFVWCVYVGQNNVGCVSSVSIKVATKKKQKKKQIQSTGSYFHIWRSGPLLRGVPLPKIAPNSFYAFAIANIAVLCPWLTVLVTGWVSQCCVSDCCFSSYESHLSLVWAPDPGATVIIQQCKLQLRWLGPVLFCTVHFSVSSFWPQLCVLNLNCPLWLLAKENTTSYHFNLLSRDRSPNRQFFLLVMELIFPRLHCLSSHVSL